MRSKQEVYKSSVTRKDFGDIKAPGSWRMWFQLPPSLSLAYTLYSGQMIALSGVTTQEQVIGI